DIDKFFGVLMMAPVSLRVHKSMRSFVFAASTAIIIIVPALHIWAYLVSAFCVLLFVNLRDPVYKAIVMGGMSFYLYFEMKHSADPPDRFEAPVPQYNA
ncbi:hypothetical protein, partial [Acinetobacter baumannii]|uniref:hypothetical protein n=2 Tax=Acinetobacter baumannii TaxID=470 RepID=UPI000D48546E